MWQSNVYTNFISGLLTADNSLKFQQDLFRFDFHSQKPGKIRCCKLFTAIKKNRCWIFFTEKIYRGWKVCYLNCK